MAVDEKQVSQSIYDTLVQAFTATPSGPLAGKPAASAGGFVTLMWPGEPIDVKLFANPWSPDNKEGSQASLENFADLVNKVPKLEAVYQDSAQKMDALYGRLLDGEEVKPQEPDPEKVKKYEENFKILHEKGIDYDDEGKEVEVWNDSRLYKNYKRKRLAYDGAIAAYLTTYFQYEDDQRKLALLLPTEQSKVDMAWDDLQNAQATKVENAVAVLGQYGASNINSILSRARGRFEQTKRASGKAPGTYYYDAFAFPSNWFNPDAEGFTKMTVDSNKTVTSESSKFDAFTANAGYHAGLWSVDASASGKWESNHTSEDTKNLSITFEFKRVDILRPWLDASIFSLPGYKLESYKPGDYSNGELDPNNKGIFPLLPTSLIIAKNVEIKADWDQKELDAKSSEIKASANVGYGPFRIGGSYTRTRSERNFRAEFSGKTISAPWPQIIGWICVVNPYCPPKID